ncbi:MAG: EfeM/EfeO family lipoprotein [Arsenophonus sp. ET-DL9-MAG3]
MHSFTKRTLIFFFSFMLFVYILILMSIKKIYSYDKISYDQIVDKIIIAKGNIPIPEKYDQSVKEYLNFILLESNSLIFKLSILEKKLKIGKLKKAQEAYIYAHQHYEAIRPIVILFGNIDRVVNARADYFINGVKDYRFTGFHLIEYQLFYCKNIKEALNETSKLLVKLRDLEKRISIENFNITNLIQASSDFIEMILETKLAGKENIYSLSDLNDIAANLRGSKEVVKVLIPFINKKILFQIFKNYQKSNDILSHYQFAHGEYKLYDQLSAKDKMVFYSTLSQQAEFLATLRTQLNVNIYHKY